MIPGLFFSIVAIFALMGVVFEIIRQKSLPPEKQHNGPRPPQIDPSDIVINGRTWKISLDEIEKILVKRCHYYNTLNPAHRQRFLKRTIRFLQQKIFIIKDENGFKEMPVLATAAAVQLTFGLKDFLLPWFRYIQIYPEEFWGHHSLRILAGNVSNRTITIAWNHLLKGNEDVADGNNVALHEMSHALYYQMVAVKKLDAASFCNNYNRLLGHCAVAFKYEVSGRTDLYTDYATTNLQEFWAESIELFFERSADLRRTYPEVFSSLVMLLKQDPLQENGAMEIGTDPFQKLTKFFSGRFRQNLNQ